MPRAGLCRPLVPASRQPPHLPPPRTSERAASPRFLPQIVVLDKLDYCATLNNLAAVSSEPNFK